MEKFKYGIIAVNPNKPDENDTLEILHFVGYWNEPTEDDVLGLWEELKNTDEFGLQDQIDEIELIPAPQEIVEMYNTMVDWDEMENEMREEDESSH